MVLKPFKRRQKVCFEKHAALIQQISQ